MSNVEIPYSIYHWTDLEQLNGGYVYAVARTREDAIDVITQELKKEDFFEESHLEAILLEIVLLDDYYVTPVDEPSCFWSYNE